jgi:hypothetical protein
MRCPLEELKRIGRFPPAVVQEQIDANNKVQVIGERNQVEVILNERVEDAEPEAKVSSAPLGN